MPKISVIIAVHNMKALLEECLAALNSSTVDIHEIIVVDDGSDRSERILPNEAVYSLISIPQHIGAAFAYNRGIDIAAGEYILFLHADILMPPKTLERLLIELERDPSIGAVSPLARRMHFNMNLLPTLNYSSWDGCIDIAEQMYVKEQNDGPHRRLFLENFCLLARTSALKQINNYNEKYLSHGMEDVDFTLELTLAGYKQLIIPHIYVHHQGESQRKEGERNRFMGHWDKVFLDKWGFYPFYAQGLRQDLLHFVDYTKESLSVMEIGCGCGGNLMEIANRNPKARLVGVEISEHSARVAKSFVDIMNIDVQTINAEEIKDRFDYIIMGDVIEHLQEPWAAIANLKKLLKNGGEIISSIPNVAHISNLYGVLQGNWQYEVAGLLDRTHMRFFTKREIVKMFVTAGFEIKRTVPTRVDLIGVLPQLREELLALKTIKVEAEDLDAYQWLTVARKIAD